LHLLFVFKVTSVFPNKIAELTFIKRRRAWNSVQRGIGDVKPQATRFEFPFPVRDSAIYPNALLSLEDGTLLVSATGRGTGVTARLSVKGLPKLLQTFPTYAATSSCLVALDGQRLAIGLPDMFGETKTMDVEVWNLANTEKEERILSAPAQPHGFQLQPICLLVLTKQKNTLAVGYGDGNVRLWNTITGTSIKTVKTGGRYKNPVSALVELRNGWLVTANIDIEVWKLPMGEKGRTISLNDIDTVLPDMVLVSENIVACAVWHSDSRISYVGLFNVKTGKRVGAIKDFKWKISKLLMLSDGTLATICGDFTIRRWDIETKTLLSTFGTTHDLSAICELKSGRIAAASEAGFIQIWQFRYQ